MIRKIISVIAGLAVAIFCFLCLESINTMLHPKSMSSNETPPILFWVILLFGWMLGAFLAGMTIKKISNSNKMILPIIVGTILTLSGVANFYLVDHPVWVIIIGLPSFLIGTIIGFRTKK